MNYTRLTAIYKGDEDNKGFKKGEKYLFRIDKDGTIDTILCEQRYNYCGVYEFINDWDNIEKFK